MQAYERFLGDVEKSADKSCRKSAPTVLVQLFRHRQVELLLRLLRYKRRNSEQWRQLHTAYQSAQAQAWADDCVPRGPAEDTSAPERTLEQQFIQILLLGAINTGQFSPRELLWASNWIARWSSLLTLQSIDGDGGARCARNGFVVDLRAAEGLKRLYSGETGHFLHLDTVPLMGAIDKEVGALNEASADRSPTASTERDGRNALLSKLRMLFAPEPVHIARRGDRRPVASSVQSISSLRRIVQMLREEAQRKPEQMAISAAQFEEITVSPTSGCSRMSTSILRADGFPLLSISTPSARTPSVWQVKDRSDSGCRLRGRTADLNDAIPRSLIAVRDGENAQWIVAVVRRLRRLMVDHIEISVEHIGRKPRFVKMVNGCYPVASVIDAPNNTHRTFGALYLPPSEKHPTMPIKTLVVPATAFNVGRTVTLLSSTATYALRLNKPLEQQSDFVWTSFTVIDKIEARSQTDLSAMAIRIEKTIVGENEGKRAMRSHFAKQS